MIFLNCQGSNWKVLQIY